MLAIPPKRPSSPFEIQTRGWTRLLARTLRLVAILAALAGPTQRSWSQNGSTNAHSGPAAKCVQQSGISEPKPQQSAIHFVAASEHSVVTKANDAPAPASVFSKSTIVPLLTIADYENYIKSDWIGPHLEDRLAPLPAPPQTGTAMPVPTACKHLDPAFCS